ncbi:hypothetical protein ACEQPO_21910 [Bacillus sp. SL00103]
MESSDSKDIPMVRINPEDQTIDIREKKMASAKPLVTKKESIHKKVGKRDMKQILHQMERITKRSSI